MVQVAGRARAGRSADEVDASASRVGGVGAEARRRRRRRRRRASGCRAARPGGRSSRGCRRSRAGRGPKPSSTIATGQSAPRSPRASVSAECARVPTPMSSTTVWSRPPPSSRIWSWPVTTVNAVATPRWVSGMPAIAGTEMALVIPGTTSTSTPGIPAGGELLAAAAEDVGVAALEPDDGLAVPGQLHEQRVDRVLRDGVVAGELADVDDLGGAARRRRRRGRRARARAPSRSATMTSAASRARSPLTVSRPGSPGPAPTSQTLPACPTAVGCHRAPPVTRRPRRFSIRRSIGPKKSSSIRMPITRMRRIVAEHAGEVGELARLLRASSRGRSRSCRRRR